MPHKPSLFGPDDEFKAPKIEQLRNAMCLGNWELALRIAARFPRLGGHKKAIERAHQAFVNPRFYRQLGQDPERLKAEGRRALLDRYGRFGAHSENKPPLRIVRTK